MTAINHSGKNNGYCSICRGDCDNSFYTKSPVPSKEELDKENNNFNQELNVLTDTEKLAKWEEVMNILYNDELSADLKAEAIISILDKTIKSKLEAVEGDLQKLYKQGSNLISIAPESEEFKLECLNNNLVRKVLEIINKHK